MNILLVDDQKVIVDSIKKGVDWENLPVEQVFTACSAREAKLVMVNFPIDLLITDIEMPEENGIDLSKWTRDKFPDMEIVFLTSHPSFDYAREGVRLRVFDYVMQPVKFTSLENVIQRVYSEVSKKQEIHDWKRKAELAVKERNVLFDALLFRCEMKQEQEAQEIWTHICDSYSLQNYSRDIWLFFVKIQNWSRTGGDWNDDIVRLIFSNVMDELLQSFSCKTEVGSVHPGSYMIF